MSSVSGGSPRNLQQQRKRAKDLLKAAQAGQADAIARLQQIGKLLEFKLAHAQCVIAREGGFESWPKLVQSLEKLEILSFEDAITSGDAAASRRLLTGSGRLRKKVNAPMFEFGRRPINAAANHLKVVDVLLEFGADISLRSEWKAGPYGVLDECTAENAHELISRGATLTAHAAARLGWIDQLRELVDANPEVVHEKGGDGQRPLHYAKTPAIADLLLDRGAEIDARCVDHHSTPAQYALKDRADVTLRLLERGAAPDIFMAARLGDVPLARQLIKENPHCVAARTNVKGYDPVPVFGIYNWVLGFYLSPHEVALQFDHHELYEILSRHSSPKVRLLDAVMRHDEASAKAALQDAPLLLADDQALLAHAALHNKIKTFTLMLALGFDPMARGMDGGTVLHMAAWIANNEMIDELLRRGVDVNALDLTHGSSPLAWAVHGSVHRRREGADYVRAIELLVKAGANVNSPGNKYGSTLIQMGEGNPQVQQALRRLGLR